LLVAHDSGSTGLPKAFDLSAGARTESTQITGLSLMMIPELHRIGADDRVCFKPGLFAHVLTWQDELG
jgi:hypothetical protein